ncbi:arginine--tRNA ligase [Candidatus Kuenenbacteria bacterium RIFCSPHIGHO2_02_FULL_39_13]|uniref:Arginine--tRNA ligase n=1 Tax=Candidatus Kuenenbacteria bacterium RIFCSPHIGHO2_02_FULL_39_13 TaxID=1798561 RepID=A0A1F6FNC9_9BACT|nr:MAG: arginine--tRNA ligase [Candidatus Kuenenbacteria bacterium RIFCSPHIGHO2_02_FULL_39_13]
MTIKDTIKQEINQVLKKKYKLENIKFQVAYPLQSELGDYACNVAMVLAKKFKKNPLEIGQDIAGELDTPSLTLPLSKGERKNKLFEKIEAAKPGFINFYLSEKTLKKTLGEILKKKDKYGEVKADKKLKIQVEFISANPTGPLTLANGRGGFSGDVLANVLSLAGHKVAREYLVNNWGNQVKILGHSILGDKEAEYSGEYINQLAKQIKGDDALAVGLKGAEIILKKYIKPAVKKMGIKFDHWFFEKELHKKGKIDKMLEELKKKNLVYEQDGALWLKTAEMRESDDKDRVLIKSNGDKTYFLADIAYHWNKFHERKFDKAINLWGADHHGYVPRMKSAMELIGYGGKLEILLMQMMRLIKNGKEVRMSKRKGMYVTMDELINEVGLDVTRFFFLMHATNKAMDFDLILAKEKSEKNPVFYVQYGHARICSIIKKSRGKLGIPTEASGQKLQPTEKELIKELIKWPELIQEVAENYEVHKLPFYAIALADKFHNFYENCRVIDNNRVIKYRLDLIKAVKQVLENVLKTLGVSAPEKM